MSGNYHITTAITWKWFDQICAIPHPSHHEDALATLLSTGRKKNNSLQNVMRPEMYYS